MSEPANIVVLAPESIEALAEAVLLKQQLVHSAVVPLKEAVLLTRNPSEQTFRNWAKRMKVRPCGYGRYSREKLQNAMAREAAKIT